MDLALAKTELSPRELAVRFTERDGYFVSEASVYRLPKAHDLIASLAFIVVKAVDEFHTKTTTPNQLWQTASLDQGRLCEPPTRVPPAEGYGGHHPATQAVGGGVHPITVGEALLPLIVL